MKTLKLIIPHSMRKKDFGKEIDKNQLQVIKKAFSKPFLPLSGKGLRIPKKTKLIKTYATSLNGAIRIVFLLLLENKNKVLLFYKPKKDKKIGENITLKNKDFVVELEKRLLQINKDYINNEYEVITIDK
jgi:hypothetical protein